MVSMLATSVPTLEMILDSGCLGESEILAGHKGLKKAVSGLTVISTPDPYHWLKPGELLLTAGYAFPSNQETICDAIRQFDGIGISGLAYKDGRYMPTLDEETFHLADTCAFPILRLPKDITWGFILDSVYCFLMSKALPTQFEPNKHLMSKVMADFISFLLHNPGLTRNSIDELSHDLQIEVSPEYSLFLIKQSSIAELIKTAQLLRSLSLIEGKDCIPVIHNGYLAVVWPLMYENTSEIILLGQSSFLQSVFRKLRLESNTQIVVPYHATIPEKLAQSFVMAKKTLSFHNWTSANQFVVRYDPFMLENNIIDLMDLDALKSFCKSTIGPLIEHDGENNANLLKTLETYLSYDCSVNTTSEHLFIHPSTVKHRLKRAFEILGLDSMKFQQKSQIYMAINIAKMLLPSQNTVDQKQQLLSKT